MVRAGVVKHPLSWEYSSGFYEVQQSPKRYWLIDLPALLALRGCSNHATFISVATRAYGPSTAACRRVTWFVFRAMLTLTKCANSQINVGHRALKRARLHSREIVLVIGASGITGIDTVLSALAIGAPLVIAVARNPARLERVRAIDPKRIATIALGRGESITNKVKQLTSSQGASLLAELAPGGIETTIECIRNLEPGGRVALIAPNPEPLNLPLRYLMSRSIEFTSVTGRFAMDVAELLQLVARRHRHAPYNDALFPFGRR
jgi:NADPH:quinone reductase-like Zn-dependent oxidoreductase